MMRVALAFCVALAGCAQLGTGIPQEVHLGADVQSGCEDACSEAARACGETLRAVVFPRAGDQVFTVCHAGIDGDGDQLLWLRLDVQVAAAELCDGCRVAEHFDRQEWHIDGAAFVDFDPDAGRKTGDCHMVGPAPFCPGIELSRQRGSATGASVGFESTAFGDGARTAYAALVQADGPWSLHFESVQHVAPHAGEGRQVRTLGLFELGVDGRPLP